MKKMQNFQFFIYVKERYNQFVENLAGLIGLCIIYKYLLYCISTVSVLI